MCEVPCSEGSRRTCLLGLPTIINLDSHIYKSPDLNNELVTMSYAVIRFDDGIYSFTPKQNIKRNSNSLVTKWKGSLYEINLIGFANKETCQEIIPNLNEGIPFVGIERCIKSDLHQNVTHTIQETEVQSNTKDAIAANVIILKNEDVTDTDYSTLLRCTNVKVIDVPEEEVFQNLNGLEDNIQKKDHRKELDYHETTNIAEVVDSSFVPLFENNGSGELINDVETESEHCETSNCEVMGVGLDDDMKAVSNMDVESMLSRYDNYISKYFDQETTVQEIKQECVTDVNNNDEVFLPSTDQNNMLGEILQSDVKEVDFDSIPGNNEDSNDYIPPASESSCNSSDSELISQTKLISELKALDNSRNSDVFDNSPVRIEWVDSDDSQNSQQAADSSNCEEENSFNPEGIAFHNHEVVSTISQGEFSAEECVPRPLLKKKPYYPKKDNFCTFCKKTNKNIERHYLQIHSNELEIKHINDLPKGCPERRRLIGALRLRGNFEYNLDKGKSDGKLLVARRKCTVPTLKYTVCPKCKIFVTKPALRRHYRNCTASAKNHNRGVLASSRALFNDVHPMANEILKTQVLPVMREDEVFTFIKYDKLLIQYGNEMCLKYRSAHHYDMIRNRLRIMGRFLRSMKCINSKIDDFASLYHPSMFDNIIEALHESGQYNKLSSYYEKPSLPSTIGTALKYIANLYIMECIKLQDEVQKKNVEDMLLLLNTGLQGPINKTASESLLHKKRQKSELLPCTEDIEALNDFLTIHQRKYYEDIIKKGFSKNSWQELMKLTLIAILIFNRRRPGELERAAISDLDNLQYINEDKDPETFQLFSEEEKKAAKSYGRIMIRGKLARGVPVLLHKDNIKYLKILIRDREAAGVHADNPYIFGIPNSRLSAGNAFKYLRAVNMLKKYSQDCGAKNPSLLKATLLRKQIATRSAQMNLDSHNVENLQNFLGHAAKIHNEYYRQPIVNRDILNMSKLLAIAQRRKSAEAINEEDVDESTEPDTSNPVETRSMNNSPVLILLPSPAEAASPLDKRQWLIDMDPVETRSTNNSPAEPAFPRKKRQRLIDMDPVETRSTNNSPISNLLPSPTEPAVPLKKRQRLIDMDLGYVPRRSWTTAERETASELFGHFIEQNMLPSLKECKTLAKDHTTLEGRSPQQIRLWVHNQINRKKKPDVKARWSSPEKRILKEVFGEYINPKCRIYPSTTEIQNAISTYKEIQNRTPRKIKSQIQHLKKLKAVRLEFEES